MKTNSWTTTDQAKDISSSPNPLVKIYEEAVIKLFADSGYPDQMPQ